MLLVVYQRYDRAMQSVWILAFPEPGPAVLKPNLLDNKYSM